MGDVWKSIATNSEFWSGIIGAVVGAIVGGMIAYFVQLRALRETRDHRREDHLQKQKGLENALLFKMIRIHSDFYGLHHHIEGCYQMASLQQPNWEPWQFILPLANFPDHIHFSSEEMGLVLGLKDDELFNMVVDMDIVHNSLIEAFKTMSTERRTLGDLLPKSDAEGATFSGDLSREQYLKLRPRMIEVNSLIEGIRVSATNDANQSLLALEHLHKTLQKKLGLSYKLESKLKQQPQ